MSENKIADIKHYSIAVCRVLEIRSYLGFYIGVK